MRVTAVRLFSNGMAHLQAEATVDGDAALSIPVRTSAMSDVLKSLSVADTSGGGGSITSVDYDSPAGGVDAGPGGGTPAMCLSPSQALLRLLRETQGAAVALSTTTRVGDAGATTVAGQLVGTQAVAPPRPPKVPHPPPLAGPLPEGAPPGATADPAACGPYGMVHPLDTDAVEPSPQAAGLPQHVAVLVLTADGAVVTVPLAAVTAFRYENPALTATMRDVLNGRVEGLTADTQLLTVRCVGTGERRIVARWCVEAPVWKTTYRLFTGGDDDGDDPAAVGECAGAPTSSPTGGPPPQGDDATAGAAAAADSGGDAPPPPPLILQGWAIIDNGFEVDLTNIRLSLLSGAGVSFKTALYERRFKARATEPTCDDAPPTGRVSDATALFGARSDEAPGGGAPRRSVALRSADAYRVQGESGSFCAGAPAASAAAFGAPAGMVKARPESMQRVAAVARGGAAAFADDGRGVGGGGGGFGGGTRPLPPPPPEFGGSADGLAAAANVATAARPAGEHSAYTVAAPVSVPRRRSAMVPILAAPVSGRRVALYRASIRRANPLSAILLTNTSGGTLEGGPMTVLHNDLLAGEAMLRSCRPGDVQLLPYAVDLDVDAEEASACPPPPRDRFVAGGLGLSAINDMDVVSELTLARGVLTAKSYRLQRVTYTFASRHGRPVALYVDHIKRGVALVARTADVRAGRPGAAADADADADADAADADAAAATPLEPTEEDVSTLRYRLTLPAAIPGVRSATTLSITERTERRTRVQLTDLSDDAIVTCVEGRVLSSAAAATVQSLAAVRGRLADAQRSVAALEADAAEEAAMQERLRSNLGALGGGGAPSAAEAALRARYVAALSDGEDAVGRLREERRRRLVAVDAARQALADAVAEARF